VLAVLASAAEGQSRRALIDQARNEFSDSAKAQLLMSALNPALGEPDSLAALAGYDLADAMLRMNRRELALTWLRWLTRHFSRWPVDRTWYRPTLVTAFDEAASEARRTGDSLRTVWRWPAQFVAASPGTVQITGDMPAAVTLSVEGRDDIQAGTVLTLPPGTYTLIAASEGYESTRLTREVLPGVAVQVDVDLMPLLPASVQSAVSSQLVRIQYLDGNEQVCRNGLFAGQDGLVLTSLAWVRGRSGLQIAAFGGQESFRDVAVVATDEARDLAVLRINTARAQPVPPATNVQSGTYAWAVHFDGCGGVVSTRTRLADWPSAPTSTVALTQTVSPGSVGSPLVDRSGMLIGLVSGPNAVLPAALTQDVLDRARRPVIAERQTGRGFPWKWVSAGVAAAGLTAVLVGRGGGGGPSTGGIVITIPN
jgi:hypothetical protein